MAGLEFLRMLSLPGGPAVITLRAGDAGRRLVVEVLATDLADLTAAVSVAERLCDATCDPLEAADLFEAERVAGALNRRPSGSANARLRRRLRRWFAPCWASR
ncbi:MAG: hypothetical protein IPQ14_10335 [Candidatus Microthrix sp.]|uniref:hypothetical protein n=1 Tax=Candidatus Neomicrothrix sp. TaxID=2719034 RepID=UPI0025C40CD1|nr:hypothetical protein [Candidatus Microthrix sp.]MBL0204699.1 hypothetical protein [Candidatus Microthrix sp.]